MPYSLIESTDAWMTRPRVSFPRDMHLYPSEASAEVTDEDGDKSIEGTCMRAAYLRYTGTTPGIPHDSRTEWIFAMGKLIEGQLIEKWKEMGIWVDNNVKFYWEEYNISGELDVILAEPPDGKLYGVEVKSFYGYDAHKQIIGSKWSPGFPKLSQLLQTCVYTYHFREKLDHFKMIYFARDDVKRKEFKIQVIQENDAWYPVVNGNVYRAFSINNVLDRYEMLQDYINAGQVPPPDYELVWSADKVEKQKEKGNVSKTAYEDWKKGKRTIGDWQCSYCQFKNYCWGGGTSDDPIESTEPV